MGTYILKRLGLILVVLWAACTMVYFMVHAAPGDVAEAVLVQAAGTEAVNEQTLSELRQKFDLDQPVAGQYLSWLGRVAQGDFGVSYRYNVPVSDMLAARLPNTLVLGAAALAISLALGVPLGVVSALRRNRPFDHASRLLTLALSSFPEFWAALVGIMAFSIALGLLPTGGMNSPASIVLPACTLAIGGVASTARMVRTSMLDVLGQDFMATARAKGLSAFRAIARHGLRNALAPLVALIALQIGHILGGAAVIESIFAWPGLGELFVSAINAKDTPMIEGCTVLIASGYACCNLVADVVYAAIDPRARHADARPPARGGRGRPGSPGRRPRVDLAALGEGLKGRGASALDGSCLR